jgi:hypothetical protein
LWDECDWELSQRWRECTNGEAEIEVKEVEEIEEVKEWRGRGERSAAAPTPHPHVIAEECAND